MEVYVANYSTGDFDDYYEVQVFVSHDKLKVEKWVKKFNRILSDYKEYNKKFEDSESPYNWIKAEYVQDYFERWYLIKKVNNAFIRTLEIR